MDKIRSWFPNYESDLAKVDRFWQGEGRSIVSLVATGHEYRKSFDDDIILRECPLLLQEQSKLPGLNLPTFYPDWGTISTARYWGGNWHFDSTGENIFIDPIAQNLDEALTLKPQPVDTPSQDAYHGISLYKQLCAQLQTDALWCCSPDMQGTLNTAGLIVNQEELLMGMYAEPEKVHAFLDRVCDFLIDYAIYLRRETKNRVSGNIWPYTFFPSSIGISLTEDLMPLLSANLYKEFGIPYLRKIQHVLGGLHIHCCGDWGRHAQNLKESGLQIKAVEFHYPATRIDELAPLAGETVFVPYILLDRQHEFTSVVEYYHWLLRETPEHYRFWFACSEDTKVIREFAEKFNQQGD